MSTKGKVLVWSIKHQSDTLLSNDCRLEDMNLLMRLDSSVTPTRNRLATVSSAEMDKLSKIKNIIRKGRLRSVTRTSLVFLTGEEEELPVNTLVVDCAVNSIKFKPKIPVFQGDKIVLQANIENFPDQK